MYVDTFSKLSIFCVLLISFCADIALGVKFKVIVSGSTTTVRWKSSMVSTVNKALTPGLVVLFQPRDLYGGLKPEWQECTYQGAEHSYVKLMCGSTATHFKPKDLAAKLNEGSAQIQFGGQWINKANNGIGATKASPGIVRDKKTKRKKKDHQETHVMVITKPKRKPPKKVEGVVKPKKKYGTHLKPPPNGAGAHDEYEDEYDELGDYGEFDENYGEYDGDYDEGMDMDMDMDMDEDDDEDEGMDEDEMMAYFQNMNMINAQQQSAFLRGYYAGYQVAQQEVMQAAQQQMMQQPQ